MVDLIPDGARSPMVFSRNGEVFADSRDVAAYFGKDHKRILQTIRELHCSDGFRRHHFVPFKINDLAGESTAYVEMTKNGFAFLVMGFIGDKAGAFKEAYVGQFDAMEAEIRKPRDPIAILNDPAAMRGLLLTYAEKVLALEADKAALTPKAEALDRIAGTDGLLSLTDAAKTLGERPSDLISWLRTHGWIYKRVGNSSWVAYQDKIQTGYLDHKTLSVERRDGSEKTITRAMVTPKGLTKLAAAMGRR